MPPLAFATAGSGSGTKEAALPSEPAASVATLPASALAAKAQHTDDGRESAKVSDWPEEATSWSAADTTATAAPEARFSSTLPAWSAAVGASLRFTSETTTKPAAASAWRTLVASQLLSVATTGSV